MRKEYVILIIISCLLFNMSCAKGEDIWNDDYILYYDTDSLYSENDSIKNTSPNNNPSGKTDNNNNSTPPVNPLYELIMDINENPTSSVQGGDVYDKYFFQGYNTNACLDIYNIEEKKYICRLEIPEPKPSIRCHANSVNFGNLRADSTDYFPLLYISSGYSKNGNSADYFVYAYRIRKDDDDNFVISLVQTITLSGFGKDGWTEGIPDIENNKFWVKYGGQHYACFNMPKLEEGDIILKHDEKIKEIDLGPQPYTSSNQDHLFVNNKILLVSGVPNKGQSLLFIAINTITGKREIIIDLQKIGITEEPESISLYGDQLLIGTWHHLYRVMFYNYK